MNLDELKSLIKFLEKREFVEIEYEHQGVRLKLRRAEPVYHTASAAPHKLPHTASPGPAPEGASQREEIAAANGMITIESPIVGTFYRAPNPENDPFVEVGDTIAKGQVLCIIEAMKIMNEIESEVEGVIKSILVENNHPVGFGDPLFIIEPR